MDGLKLLQFFCLEVEMNCGNGEQFTRVGWVGLTSVICNGSRQYFHTWFNGTDEETY